ncbi:MAG: hypothetical protein F4Y47_09800 [Acidobacteriia bacterium]|nr:hypothetical protein [Terriglobia bacterium]MYK10114.1 hypothetical protein [Terriglobia bacterium]
MSAIVALAEAQEWGEPIGCQYVCMDVADFMSAAPVEVVTAIHLLNHARTVEDLERFDCASFRVLRSGGLPVVYNTYV